MAILDSFSREEIKEILYADSFFICRRSPEEKKEAVELCLKQISKSSLHFPEVGSCKVLFFRSLPREDYKKLFRAIIDSSGVSNKIVVEDYESNGDFINLHLSRYITENISAVHKVQGADLQERLYKTIKLVYYAYIVERLQRYKFEAITFFADMQPVEHMASIYFKKQGLTTVTMQHGLYIDYGSIDTVNVINYKHQPSKYFLAWGRNTEELISKNNPNSNVVVCGKPNLQPIEDDGCIDPQFFVVILDQEIFQAQNSDLISYSKRLAKERGLKFAVKFHPYNNKSYYKKVHGDIEETEDLSLAKLVIGHTSSLIYEWKAKGGQVLQYLTEIPTIKLDDSVSFKNYDKLLWCFDNLNSGNKSTSVGSNEIRYISRESKEKYSEFYGRLLNAEKKPQFSIIVPTYNSQYTICRCIDSLLGQTNQNFEIIVVDGCSNDFTVPLVMRYEERDDRIKIFSEPDVNVYDAMNKGIEKAAGRWLYFMGSDDQLCKETVLEKFSDKFDGSQYGLVYGNVKLIGDVKWAKDGTIYDGEFTTQKIKEKNICHQAIFYNAEALKKVGKYNIKYRVCGDWDMNLRIWANFKCTYFDEIVANFFSGGTSTEGGDPEFGKDFKKIKQELFGSEV